MGMNPAYEKWYEEVHELEFKVKDALDQPNNPSAQELRNEMRELHEDFEKNRNPRDIENRIKSVQELLWEARSHPDGIMDIPDADHFYRIFEDMRRAVRNLPNY